MAIIHTIKKFLHIPEKIEFDGKQLLIMHTVLETLGRFCVSISGQSKLGNVLNGKDGEVIPNYKLIGTPEIHYGTMLALINNPAIFDKEIQDNSGNIDYIKNRIAKRSEIPTSPYTFADFNSALNILRNHNDITLSYPNETCRIGLGDNGLYSLGTQKYLLQYYEIDNAMSNASTINKTYWILAIVAVISLAISIPLNCHNANSTDKEIQILKDSSKSQSQQIQALKNQPLHK